MIDGVASFLSVLLPDGKWHAIDRGSFSWMINGNFRFRENGRTIEGRRSSVLAVWKDDDA